MVDLDDEARWFVLLAHMSTFRIFVVWGGFGRGVLDVYTHG